MRLAYLRSDPDFIEYQNLVREAKLLSQIVTKTKMDDPERNVPRAEAAKSWNKVWALKRKLLTKEGVSKAMLRRAV